MTRSSELKSPSPRKATSLKSAASWLSLVAATTAGLGPSATVRARVRADVNDDGDALRLVVQSYRSNQFSEGALPDDFEKPVASAQRAVTPDELRRGVVVEMVQPTNTHPTAQRSVVVAWIERGRPDLQYDARLARPQPGLPRGCAKARGTAADMNATVHLATG